MDRIRQVFSSLSKAELKSLKHLLSVQHSKGDNKPLELLRMLEHDPQLGPEQAAEKLYGDAKSKAFIMMKSRLYERMLDFLCVWGENTTTEQDEVFYGGQIQFRKATLRASVLRSRKLKNLALPFWEESAEYARKCCAPEWEMDALIQIRNSYPLDLESFERLSQHLAKSSRAHEVNLNAAGIFGKFIRLKNRKTYSEQPFEYLNRILPELEAALQETPSPRAQYYYLLMCYYLADHRQDFGTARLVLQHLAALCEDEKGLVTNSRYFEPRYQIGLLELKLLNFNASIQVLQEMADSQKEGSDIRNKALLLMAYPMLCLGNLQSIVPVFQELERTLDKTPTSARLKPQLSYLKGCHAFLMGKPSDAWMCLQDAMAEWSDEAGSAVGLRLFEIMLLVGRGMDDIAGQKLESLRKHITKYGCTERFKSIFKILSWADKQGFSIKAGAKETSMVSDLQKLHPWDPSFQEVIRFEQWHAEHRNPKF